MAQERYHFLDGLRGGAMLLGLVLHGLLSFAGIPAWPAEDVRSAPGVIYPVVDWIHGFRMPLFFLVSGFFTAMMWRKRGMGGLVKQRLLRIGVPLLAGVVVIYPAMLALADWGGEVKEARVEERGEELVFRGLPLLVLKGDYEGVRAALARGADANARDDYGTPVLHLAAMMDDDGMVGMLLENGADLEGRGIDGGTALMAACFFGREEAGLALLEAGADVSVKDAKGATVMHMTMADFELVKTIGEALKLEVTEKNREARERLAKVLAEGGAGKGGGSGWYWVGVFWPVWHHLWFLYDLLWLLVVFVPVALLAGRLGWRLPDCLVSVPGCLLWLVPLTWWAQMLMPGQFGPGTSTGIFPWPAKLAYYGVFFFFGAICFGRGFWEKKVGRIWWGWVLLSLPLWWWGRDLVKSDQVWGGLLAAGFAWAMILALMGLFRRFLNEGRPQVPYFSDSSYWLYLAHLPVMIAGQILISNWNAPLVLKLGIVVGGVTAVLLMVYEGAIRSTWVGALLNGRKSRVVPPPLSGGKES